MKKSSGFNISLCLILISLPVIFCLDNGLALTPPMGWLSWERFKCNIDCDADFENCISEKLFIEMALQLLSEGYKDAGYLYINIDDCWMAPFRDSDGNMKADPIRFPHGIKFLADFMHARGLRLGIYQDFGLHTCMGYPGIVGHMKQDADTFSKWGVDMIKLDGCHSQASDMDEGYIEMGIWLNKTNKPIIYSCSWPYYQLIQQMEPNYTLISTHCNLWRNYHDIQDSWESIEQIIDFYGDNQEVLALHSGPGHWNDLDMLMIGNFHLTAGQARIQMAIWCIIPAPLLMSNDLRRMKPEFQEILLNKGAIEINQDLLGKPGKRIFKENDLEIWRRPILPKDRQGETSFALLFLNRHFNKREVKVLLSELGLNPFKVYSFQSVFSNSDHGVLLLNGTITVSICNMDVVMFKCRLRDY